MNKLNPEKRARILACLVEGNSIRATCRLTGAAKGTVLKLLRDVGYACAEYQDRTMRDLPCRRVQCDEAWGFVQAKERNVSNENKGKLGHGDTWVWTALDADTKLIASWYLGQRGIRDANLFMQDLASRLAHRVQLSTDGYKAYLDAVDDAFAGEIDYGMLVKIYGPSPEGQVRYSPAKCIGARRNRIVGTPDRPRISTSFVERQNLTLRMSIRRLTRLTNGFSKNLEGLFCALALHVQYYNFARIHQTLRVTPAMEAGISAHVWSLEEIAALADSN